MIPAVLYVSISISKSGSISRSPGPYTAGGRRMVSGIVPATFLNGEPFYNGKMELAEILAKIDTGARSSSLHVTRLRLRRRGEGIVAEFVVHPVQHRNDPVSILALIVSMPSSINRSMHRR